MPIIWCLCWKCTTSFCEESCFHFLSFELIKEGKGIQRNSPSEFLEQVAMLLMKWVEHKKCHRGIIVFISTHRNFRQQWKHQGISGENGGIYATLEKIPSHLKYICFGFFSSLSFENFYSGFLFSLYLFF